jgi:hypothetical protein
MWRRPRMLSKSGGATSDAILAVFGVYTHTDGPDDCSEGSKQASELDFYVVVPAGIEPVSFRV